jgi:hypothetical protein
MQIRAPGDGISLVAVLMGRQVADYLSSAEVWLAVSESD